MQIARQAGRFAWRLAPALLMVAGLRAAEEPATTGWKRHVIDDSSRGADGVRLADVNGDGWLDIAVGWADENVSRFRFGSVSRGHRAFWERSGAQARERGEAGRVVEELCRTRLRMAHSLV
jgi:hypothetical protein